MSELIVTITGSSGAGKSTLEKNLGNHYGGGRVVTITTRPPRKGEIPGVHYHFETLESLGARTDLLWNVTIHHHNYLVSDEAFHKALEETRGVAFVSITPERHVFVRDRFGRQGLKTLAIHLKPPSEVELRRRLSDRGESLEMIEKRLQDSTEFEKNARLVPNLHFIEPQKAESTFIEVLKLIQAAQ